MSTLPAWIQILQALLTPVVTVAVVVVAFLQWRTAHQKVVLDVFDRRLSLYEAVIEIYDDWQRDITPNSTVKSATRKLRRLEMKANFLFGDEVPASIAELRLAMLDLWPFLRAIDEAQDRQKWSEISEAAQPIEKRIKQWRADFSRLCLPYMKLDQRRVGTLSEWLRYRNELRKSYGDQH